MTTRIAFLGFNNAFDYHHVGGTDSLVRRLAKVLAMSGDTVDLVLYGASEAICEEVDAGVTQRTFVDLDAALDHLGAGADHVISIYLRPRDRRRYARFRRRVGVAIRFHHLYTTWNESYLKRSLLFAENRLWPFNGHLFCISPRICRAVSRWSSRATVLLPPVPRSYFCEAQDKPDRGTLRVAYAGRLDAGKGASDAIATLRGLVPCEHCELFVYGYAWPWDMEGMRLHEELLADRDICYQPVDHRQWSPAVEEALRQFLRDTDVLLLPYQRLSSTIDMPLLLLEGMANLCAVVTPQQGDLHETYGMSHFAFSRATWDASSAARLIGDCRSHLGQERQRLETRCTSLGFEADVVGHRLKEFLGEDN